MEPAFYRIYLQAEFDRRVARNRRYSLRAFSKAIELNAGTLSRVLRGKRSLSPKLAARVLEHLPLSPTEREQFLASTAPTSSHDDSP